MDSQPDEDQGDISLLLAAARTPTRRTSPPQPIPAIDLDVAVPQRNRLFLEPQRARGVSTDRPISSSANTHSRNDSPGNDLSDDGATTPESTTRKFWDGKASDIGPRPSSAQPPVSENPSQSAIAPHPTQPPARRTPSSLGRSRSLNVRMPSAMPSANTSYHQLGASSTPLSATEVCPTPSDKIGWARRPGEPRPPPLVGEDVARKMGRWIKEIVVCNFDLERGPVVERRAGGRRWGLGEKENVYVHMLVHATWKDLLTAAIEHSLHSQIHLSSAKALSFSPSKLDIYPQILLLLQSLNLFRLFPKRKVWKNG